MLMPKLHVGYFEIPGKKNFVIIHREKRTNIWYTLYEEGARKHPSGVTILSLKKYTYSERKRGERASVPNKRKGEGSSGFQSSSDYREPRRSSTSTDLKTYI